LHNQVRVKRTGATVNVNLATVGTADVLANAGLAAIHIINQVLMIPDKVSEIAMVTSTLQTLSSVLESSVYSTIKTAVNAGAATVFAPTDTAFAAITLPTDTSVVMNLLKYHVLGTKVLSTNLPSLSFPRTLLGIRVQVAKASSVTVGSATVTSADVLANAGQTAVIHIIDQVLQIPGSPSAVLGARSDLSSITAALVRANLVSTVDGLANSTLFIPANGAKTSTALAALSGVQLTNTILQHVLNTQTVFSTDLSVGTDLTTACPSATELGCQVLKITKNAQKWYVNGVEIATTDILTSNGVIHIISEPLALKPKSVSAASALTMSCVALMAVVATMLM